MKITRIGGAVLTALCAAWACAPAQAADATDAPKEVFDQYFRETSTPAVPAATLLGVDKSKIVEVASVSKLGGTLTAASKASNDGTPFGIDLSPAMFVSDKDGGVARAMTKGTYASDMGTRLLFRTRLSLASARKDNSDMRAWGVYTRPIDLRDPFVDPALEQCLDKFVTGYRAVPRGIVLPPVSEVTEQAINNVALALQPFGAERDDVAMRTLRVRIAELQSRPAGPGRIAGVNLAELNSWHNTLKQVAGTDRDSKVSALHATYSTCATAASNQLANRSYLAVGYSRGAARAVDGDEPLSVKPGQSTWITFVYGFEGLANVFGGEDKWRSTGAAVTSTPTALQQNARLTLHYARNRGSSKLVDAVEQDTSGRTAGIGFDYAVADTKRLSAQVVHSREGNGSTLSTERTAVLGADFKVQEGLWLGLSWGRRSQTTGDADKEVKAQLKWAFSDTSWLK